MTDQPATPEPCEHHWISYGQPSHSPLRWILKCSQCNQFNIERLQEEAQRIKADAWDEVLELLQNDSAINYYDLEHCLSLNPYRKEQDDE